MSDYGSTVENFHERSFVSRICILTKKESYLLQFQLLDKLFHKFVPNNRSLAINQLILFLLQFEKTLNTEKEKLLAGANNKYIVV
jgi:hypothetical protein